MTKFKFLFIIFGLLCLLTAQASAQPLEIKLEQQAYCHQDTVTLGSIAQISGGNQESLDKIKSIYIGRAPSTGQHIRLTRSTLERKIYRAGFRKDDFQLESPQRVKIYGSELKVKKIDIISKAEQVLKERNLWNEWVNLSKIDFPYSVNVNSGTVEYQVNTARDEQLSEIIKVNIDLIVNGEKQTGAYLEFIDGSMENNSADSVSKEKSLMTGVEITNRDERIRWGDPLKLQFVRDGLTITVDGEALESGYPGEMIRVKANSTNKEFKATLKNGKTALIKV